MAFRIGRGLPRVLTIRPRLLGAEQASGESEVLDAEDDDTGDGEFDPCLPYLLVALEGNPGRSEFEPLYDRQAAAVERFLGQIDDQGLRRPDKAG